MSTTVPRPTSVPLRPPIGSRRRATLLEVLSSTDHKRIGLLTMVTAFCPEVKEVNASTGRRTEVGSRSRIRPASS